MYRDALQAEREGHQARMREFEASNAREVAARHAPLEARREAADARAKEQAARAPALRKEHKEELRRIEDGVKQPKSAAKTC